MFDFISKNPELVTVLFGVANFLWAIFLYFNNKKHQQNIESLKHSLNLDLERRKKVFEMKVNQFEKYYRLIDEFGKKYSVDLPKKLQPIFTEYYDKFLKAEMENNKEESRKIIVWFGDQIGNLMLDINENYVRLNSETNSLKLTSSDKLVDILNELQKCYEDSFNLSSEFISKFQEILLTQNQVLQNDYQNRMKESAMKLKNKSDELMARMRFELTEI
ncbi:hypothetical protein MROS_0584 [Melioribacter roseus P3M-2]|uniref:Uncharacterized protein n=1 Tax=Melioribacter roseus (strain DSM 23840 / JCM 17771 / VKM B-2668 / P3M-2) TaxID=1191523 RepID=I6YTF0_MELRP|nr:hypothetical protein [Melioribacter roseus]AFN73827.1 hypothetical protein MROS_0584 [Melioribacter roseus P3M-2]